MVNLIIGLLFAVVFVEALVAYVRRRDELQRDVVFVFSAMAVVFVLEIWRHVAGEPPRLVSGAAHVFRTEMRKPQPASLEADVHGTPAQRLYNLLCVAYGADRELFRDVAKELPKERAEGCESEYNQVAYAVRKLIQPYVNQRATRMVMAAKFLPDAAARPACYLETEAGQRREDCPPAENVAPEVQPVMQTASLPASATRRLHSRNEAQAPAFSRRSWRPQALALQ